MEVKATGNQVAKVFHANVYFCIPRNYHKICVLFFLSQIKNSTTKKCHYYVNEWNGVNVIFNRKNIILNT